MSMLLPLMRNAALLCLAFVLMATPAAAQWVVQSTSGTALVLRGDRWVGLAVDDVLEGNFTVRTLRASGLNLASRNVALSLSANAASTISSSPSPPARPRSTSMAAKQRSTLMVAPPRSNLAAAASP